MNALFGSFDNAQVAVLQLTFDVICQELGIDAADEQRRSRIAASVIALAKTGQFDPDHIKVQAVSQLRADEGERTI
ncbi:MAG: hypothetical protein JSR99_03130 [Proteobacteria bacterium]|nr:hypothetical protein [Pseudomonadota bacterium]